MTHYTVQKFQIGQRVQPKGASSYVIRTIFYSGDGQLMYGNGGGPEGRSGYSATTITLVSERPPYVPSERRVLNHDPDNQFHGKFLQHYRCETDAELTLRHAIERAVYNAQGEGK